MDQTTSCNCGSDNQNPQSPIHFFHLGCSNTETLDPWHYTGSKSWHSDKRSADFINLCKLKLPKQKLPIRIGWTGYINADSDIFTNSNSWCFDEQGRVVILFNKILMFQRYTEGDLLMKSKDGITYNSVTSDDLNSFTSMLL